MRKAIGIAAVCVGLGACAVVPNEVSPKLKRLPGVVTADGPQGYPIVQSFTFDKPPLPSSARDGEGVRLAPIYDLAPMVMDEQGVTRATRWPAPVEQGGTINWREVCQLLAAWDDPERLWLALRNNAERLRAA